MQMLSLKLVSRYKSFMITIQFIIPAELPSSQPTGGQRRSSRTGKGNGGQLQQLQNIERIQTAAPVRSSARSLENATQGHPVNPMAPSHRFDDEDLESQVPSWAAYSAVSAESLQSQAHRPLFTLSQPGYQFGFKLPSTSGPGNTGGTIQSTRMPSSAEVHTR